MTDQRMSYLKTTLLAALAGAIVVVAIHHVAGNFAGLAGAVVLIISWFAAMLLFLVSIAGCLVLYREYRLKTGQLDLFLDLNRSRSEYVLGSGGWQVALAARRFLFALTGSQCFIVGDLVKIKPVTDILGTLDKEDSVDGLPFLPEMVQYCGKSARVYRRVDKVYDYGGKKNLRRLKNTVLLHGLRCSGSQHGACQAGCYLLWKEEWLEHARESNAEVSNALGLDVFLRKPAKIIDESGAEKYSCQFTSLVTASAPMKAWDIRQDLRPLMSGNLTLAAFLVAILTRLFNRAQFLRGGMGYPMIGSGNAKSTPVLTLELQPSDLVRVRNIEEISRTLDSKGKNRGLWFDRDMVKHCGQEYHVLKRVDKIIDDATGLMRTMKTPCIVLDGVSYSGEGLRFCSQEDPTFWREAWLEPANGKNGYASSSEGRANSAGGEIQ